MERKKILVVEDDENSLFFIKYNLEINGFEVRTAEDGVEGLRVLRDYAPDLIISDIMMPQMDGFEFCQRVKGDAELAHIPVVFLSAKGMVKDRVRGLRVGASEFIVKPFDPEELVARVEVILERANDAIMRSGSGMESLSGSLSETDITDLLQMLKMGRKTGQLSIIKGNEDARILFRDGVPFSAYCGLLDDEEAIYRVITWQKGQFTFEPRMIESRKSIKSGLQKILLDGSRIADELKNIADMVPKPEIYFELNREKYRERLKISPEEEHIVHLVDMGLNWGKICELSSLGDYETRKTVIKLLSDNLLIETDAPEESLTGNITGTLHNLVKFSIQLNRPETTYSYKRVHFPYLYARLNDRKSKKQILCIPVLAMDDYLLEEMLSELNSEENKIHSDKAIHLGEICTRDFRLYLIGVPVRKRYQKFHNYLVKISVGKIILADSGNYNCLEELAMMEDIVFDQRNKEHTIVLLRESLQRTEGLQELKEKVRIQFLKSSGAKVLIKDYANFDVRSIFDIIKKVLYSFLP